jgi:glyoxylase-like metal-dependent hydrolase (beta-lactamase superfamily II)
MTLRIFALALLVAGCAVTGERGAVEPSGNDLYREETLDAHVRVLTQGDAFHVQPRGNVEIIEQRGGFVVIDSGGSPAGADEAIAALRRVAATKPVTALVLTHWHGDHSLGVSRFLETWPNARIIGSPASREALLDARADQFMPGDNPEANRRYLEGLAEGVSALAERGRDVSLPEVVRRGYANASIEYARFAREMSVAHRVAPTEEVSNRLVLDDAQTPVEISFFGRANTKGDLIVWLPRQRIAITGDVLVRPIPYGFNSYVSDWIGVLDRIEALHPRVVAVGHGEPQFDLNYLRLVRRMLASTRAEAAAVAGDASITPDNVATRIDLSSFEPAVTHGDPWAAWWFERYWKRPIASSALREARGEAIEPF